LEGLPHADLLKQRGIWTLKTGLTQQLGQLEQLVQTTSIQLLPIQQTLIEKQKVEEGHLEKCFQGNTC
jgi:hypothetical protein